VIDESIPLAPLTSIGLGGRARYFCLCTSIDDLRTAMSFAREKNVPVHILGGGSNTLFADDGFEGLVIKMGLLGFTVEPKGTNAIVTAAAGECWDDVVRQCTEQSFAGIECLAGIPGLAGATPIQNVGAYGQEVADTILRVHALDRASLREVAFSPSECRFSYRQSRFKREDADQYVITAMEFSLLKSSRSTVHYAELKRALTRIDVVPSSGPHKYLLTDIREAVLTLRRRKSMLIDPADPNTRSVGSFFMNPFVGVEQYEAIVREWKSGGGPGDVPAFRSTSGMKISAAWLVEQAGFPKGTRSGGVGVSTAHALALVNYTGTCEELLSLAERIVAAVRNRFGITLEREPVVVGSPRPAGEVRA
jgi:UDP-N-acetylmuramate dehydrogenase